MLDLPGRPELPKLQWIGGAARLPLRVDAGRLATEVATLPEALWGSRGGRVGVHEAAEAIWLRGHAPAQGILPIEDRPPLAQLPYVRELIGITLGGSAQRCLLARLPAGAVIGLHVDRAPYFAKTLRVHVPILTHPGVHMLSAGRCYTMSTGEAWTLNNSAPHAVWNAHTLLPRTHLICDFVPTPRLLDLLGRAERELGRIDDAVLARVSMAAPVERG
ncbi:MAG: aspartyl/asparaginyl beta-hydroxylase domain-containing protein [Panacagrimonas sp.]